MKFGICLLFAAASCLAQDLARSREVFQKVCGTCHAVSIATAERHTRAEWQDEIAKMVVNGAKATDEEFALTLDYLASQYGPSAEAPSGGRGGRGAAPVRTGGAGPDDKHVVDPVAADRGRKTWAAECINCHGTDARGTDNGANLVRSVLVLHDRYGDTIGPYLRKGHPMQSGGASASLSEAQIQDLAHFIHQRLYDTLRGSPIFHAHDIVTGNPQAGAAYFNGDGKCATCHSPTRDLAGIASKYDASTLQGRFLNPRPMGGRGGGRGGRGSAPARPSGPQVTLTVTTASGESVTGTPVLFDDFNVALRDASGDYHCWKRTPGLKVVKHDPYAAHDELLETYTDKNMHDLLAYLETLK
jgi:mono/diheme cytochrome c family protein